jgi:prophage antirepressor-like protein
METFIDILNNTVEYNNNIITIIIDDNDIPWFSASPIAKLLEYVNAKQAIIDNVDSSDKKSFDDLLIIFLSMLNHMPFILMNPDYMP